MQLSDDELDLLAAAYADNSYVAESYTMPPSVVNVVVKRLLDKGLMTEERKPRNSAWGPSFWLARPSPRGVQFVRAYDPAEMIRAFIRVDCLPCAVLWIYNWMKSLGELPEFISHANPSIRKAAKVRFEELVRDNGYELNRP